VKGPADVYTTESDKSLWLTYAGGKNRTTPAEACLTIHYKSHLSARSDLCTYVQCASVAVSLFEVKTRGPLHD
jgi:hypothetical protein